MKNYNHVKLLMDKLEFDEDAKKFFCELEEKILADDEINSELDKIRKIYLFTDKNFDAFSDRLQKIADKLNVSVYSINFILLMNSSDAMLARYRKKGISEDIYWDSISDIKCKLIECKNCRGVWGSFVPDWFKGFYELTRFKLGRFEYEETDLGISEYKKHGVDVKKDDIVVNFHIPSSGIPLTYDVRVDSYKKAYEFFKPLVKDGKICLVCSSWLLYPGNDNILPEKSNIREFMHDFEILQYATRYDFRDGWRVFGKDFDKPVNELPTDTKLRAAFAKWLQAGKQTGHAYGIIVFDGENILTRHN